MASGVTVFTDEMQNRLALIVFSLDPPMRLVL